MRIKRAVSIIIASAVMLMFGSCAQAPPSTRGSSALLTQYSDMPLSGENTEIGMHDDEYGFHIVNRIEFTHPEAYSSKHVAHSYQTLKKEAQKMIYDKVIDACYCFSDEKVEGDTTYKMRPVILDGTGYNIRETEAAIVAVFDDHPEIFWMNYLFELFADPATNTTMLLLRSEYTADQVAGMMKELDKALAAFYQEMPKELSEYEREVYVYKYIIDHCVYDDNIIDNTEYEDAHPSLFNLYGVMVDHTAVCEGYAYSFDYLCSELGVDTVCICGTVEDDGEDDILHLWNAVMRDNEWYQADVTWDDPDEDEEVKDVYIYLNVTDRVMAQDHTLDQTYDQITDEEYDQLTCSINNFLPSCTATEYCYYLREGITLSKPDVELLTEGIIQAAERKSAALMVNVDSGSYTLETMADALFDGDQPYYMAVDKANTALAEAPLDNNADAVYYYYDDRKMIVFEMPYQ